MDVLCFISVFINIKTPMSEQLLSGDSRRFVVTSSDEVMMNISNIEDYMKLEAEHKEAQRLRDQRAKEQAELKVKQEAEEKRVRLEAQQLKRENRKLKKNKCIRIISTKTPRDKFQLELAELRSRGIILDSIDLNKLKRKYGLS